MKVGLLTFPNSVSYGCVLQMYALYCTVQAMGHEAEVINYQNRYMKQERHMGGNTFKGRLRRCVRGIVHRPMYCAFRKFENKIIRAFPERVFEDSQRLSEIGNRYDAVICGSDQVWNPDITNADMSYFLDFCGEKTRRIAYAPSFGVVEFTEELCCKMQRELRQFYALSVRETPGKKLVESLTERNVQVVMDPTFFLSTEQWIELEEKHPAAHGEYILYFTVRSSKTLLDEAIELSKKTGMKLVIIGGNPIRKIKKKDNVEYAVDIGPGQWLYLMHNARYILTNSFHGTAFAINFRKDFYVEYSAKTNSRLIHILEVLGLTDRVVGTEAIHPTSVNYTIAERELLQLQKEAWTYLQQALQ